MAESLGLSPNSTKIMVASALGTFAGSAMAAKAPAAAAVTSTRVGKQPVRAEPQAMAGASSSASEPLSLKGRPRGSQVVVQVAAEYGARKVYTFSDVCALATRIMAGTVMVADLRQKNTDGAWTYGIPRSTMTEKWLKDDHSVMQSQNPPRLGVEGSPHWLVERDVRGRTELSKPGPGTVMGGGETQLIAAWLHYDCWALRLNSYWDDYTNGLGGWKHQWMPPVGSPPVLVSSAFGGFAIYRNEAYLAGTYDGTRDCEHVPFHKSVAKATGQHLYLCPSMRTVMHWME